MVVNHVNQEVSDNQQLRRFRYVTDIEMKKEFIILLYYLSLSARASIKRYLRLANISCATGDGYISDIGSEYNLSLHRY